MAFLDEYGRQALKREMSVLAAELAVDGVVKLRPRRADMRYMQRLPGMAAGLEAETQSDGLRILGEGARTFQVCARRAATDGGRWLPGCGRYARISLIAERLVDGGDRSVDGEAMQYALKVFDEAQGLTMDEYWAFPEAVRIAVCESCVREARRLIAAAEDRISAGKWVESGGSDERIYGCSAAFYEHALQLAAEQEKPELRLRLENALQRMDTNAEVCVKQAQESSALAVMRLGNLLADARAVESADWRSIFEVASRTEAELRNDPDGIYPRMSEDSRAAVRKRVALIAGKVRAGETTVARYAVNAAREMPAGDVRRSVCWWLYDDEGSRSLAARFGGGRRIPRIYPDPHGAIYMSAQLLLTALLCVIAAKLCGAAVWGLAALPPVWTLVSFLTGTAVTRTVKPRAVLRMEYEKLPDSARTLVAVPALLGSPEQARRMCRRLEALGCLEHDENLEFVLLGDLPDAPTRLRDSDEAVVYAADEEIERINAAAGRHKYHFLCRERSYVEQDGIYRGRERKRGALMALCRVATGKSRGEFTDSEAEDRIFGRFRYLVTLDADTKMLPGTAAEMVGAISHPLNRAGYCGAKRRGFAVMHPRVELDAADCVNTFVRMFAGSGGLSTYSGMASDMFHDIAGAGSYCGKGVLDMPAFLDALEGKLDGGRVLSHDFIEGLVGGAGYINDIAVYDGSPEDYGKWLARAARWTRGDWQLIPDIFRKDIPMLGRFRIVSHLVESLREISLMAIFVFALWVGNAPAFAAAIGLSLITPVLQRLMGDKLAFVRGSFEIAVLPAAAFVRGDAILRALWRTFVSGRRLLEWVTSADAKGDADVVKAACRCGAILLLPGLFGTYWIAPALALGALFVIGPGLASDLSRRKEEPRLDEDTKRFLHGIARDTWWFFERYVDAENNFLPPDNVQIDPDNGAARRTSPTNIGMYMFACVSARELGIIGDDELRLRLSDTLNTLERMEKWNGNIYNWYDTETLQVLTPRYVSAVDSGNLAAALMLCANACGDKQLAGRLDAAARAMRLDALYDGERELFHIGVDVETGRRSASYYDLLASEARILSYTAIMLGQIPVKHWRRLGRPVSGDALLSWSGTMFEYFMPALIMPSAPGSLLGRTYRGVIREQMHFASARSRPWGVSESGYHAFDRDMNYQYRAFGLRSLSMSGTLAQDVVAPYGACLGLMTAPVQAAENIRYIAEQGWAGECGLYEAIDFVRSEPRPVKSWMAHHQGMALCAVCNALTDDRLQRYFMDRPDARALELLLNEQPVSRIRLRHAGDVQQTAGIRRSRSGMRRGNSNTMLMDTCLLGGAGAAALVSARGDIIYSRDGVYAARFTGDVLRRGDTLFTEVTDANGRRRRINSRNARCMFGPGEALFTMSAAGADIELRLAVSPEDGALVKYIRMTCTAEEETRLTVTDGLETALMDMGEMRAHPAFHRLFCRTELMNKNAVITRRRMREKGAAGRVLVHAASCAASGRETDWLRYAGREGGSRADLAGRSGAQTDPCSVIRTEVVLQPGEVRELAFAVGICGDEEAARLAERYSDIGAARRVCALAASYVRSAAGFAGLDDEKRVIAERGCAVLADPRLACRGGKAPGARAEGDHGELPRICVTVNGTGGLDVLRDAVHMHEYCRLLGFVYQLALVHEHDGGYDQPVRDGIRDIIGASHLRDMCYARGGITVYDAMAMPGDRRAALMRGSALVLDGGSGYWPQLKRSLLGLYCAGGGDCTPMPAEETGVRNTGEMLYGRREGDSYCMEIAPGLLPPAPWSNIITADKLGMLITERGGGFIWQGNSRLRRVTCFDNDPADEGWNCMIYITDENGRYIRALPGKQPDRTYQVRHSPAGSTFCCGAAGMDVQTEVFADAEDDALIFRVTVRNAGDVPRRVRVTGFVNWLMGADGGDAAYTRSWNRNGALFASGTLDTVGYLACTASSAEICPARNAFLGNGGVMLPDGLGKQGDGGCAVAGILDIGAYSGGEVSFVLGCTGSVQAAEECAARMAHADTAAVLRNAEARWKELSGRFTVHTGDEKLDWLVNGFLLKQVLDGRIRARAGFYQAGGAYGFRDQLQDMLALLPYSPETVRSHLLECARHQFRDGDVMHWWHPPMTGVRTHISDDMLFLPFVTYHYVRHTGDRDVLDRAVPYLENIEIPDGREDIYSEMKHSSETGTLEEHCMRAFRRACRRGAHGLLLMGAGDWNDGMNRIGYRGRGESVWLTMFFAVCARLFAGIIGEGMDRAWLLSQADELTENIRKQGWDGKWYLRAYDDNGEKLGSSGNAECSIDLIAQAWSAFADCEAERVDAALDSAWRQLFVPEHSLMKLLTPPFSGEGYDPGYIGAYPPGVRENGGQYTHAACWMLIALAKNGDADRAGRLLEALMPLNHAATTKDADKYRVEPYVVAADIYGEEPYAGRGGWTWYTGAAGWLMCGVRYLLGYERRGDAVRLNALRGMWTRPQVCVRFGSSEYTLISDDAAVYVTLDGRAAEGEWIRMEDDGKKHECVFPSRNK